jgi:hypothetical protein
MKPFLFALSIASSLFVASPASAQTSSGNHVFSAVDSVTIRWDGQLTITGVLLGEASASTHGYNVASDSRATAMAQSCLRLATIAMEKPGAFRLQIAVSSGIAHTCQLSRVTP